MTFVLAACAIIAYLRNENRAEAVEAALLGDNDCVVHVPNICEVYYDCLRRGSTAQADELLEDLSTIGLITRDDIDASYGRPQRVSRRPSEECPWLIVLPSP